MVARFQLDNNSSLTNYFQERLILGKFQESESVCVSELSCDTQSVVTITLQDEEMVHRADYIQEEGSCEAKSSNLTIFVFVLDVELMMQMTKSSCEYLLEESWSCAIDSMNRALSRIDIGSDVLLMGVDHLSSK